MINQFMWLRRRELMVSQSAGPTNGLVEGTYGNGKAIVSNNNEIQLINPDGTYIEIPLQSSIEIIAPASAELFDNATGEMATQYGTFWYRDIGSTSSKFVDLSPFAGRTLKGIALSSFRDNCTLVLKIINAGQPVC